MMSGDRILSLFGALALQIVGLGILLFWAIGVVLLVTGNGGQINDLVFAPWQSSLFYAYPFLLVLFSVVGWLAYLRKLDLVALGALSAAPGLLAFLYVWMIFIG